METLLNLLWLIVALGLIGLWRFRWCSSRQNRGSGVLPEIVAIGCAISLLLPVISLTDDLHPEIVAVDTVSGKRNSGLLMAGVMPPHASPVPSSQSIPGIANARLAEVELKCAGIVVLIEAVQSSTLCSNRPGRSPPSLL